MSKDITMKKFKEKWNKKKWFILGVITPVIYLLIRMLYKQ